MKIASFKIYQAITFMGRNETWIDVKKYNSQQAAIGKSGFTVEEKPNGLLLIAKEEAVLATWNNIAFVNYELSDLDDQKSKNFKKHVKSDE